jgi:RNA polymerase sigma-70 factor (ECF subfamily)
MPTDTDFAIADADLVRRAQAGDLTAFETLVSRHERTVYSVALRLLRHEQDAEDATQQTFISAIEGLDGFRGDASFKTWLLRIATHAALKIIRKRDGLPMTSLDAATEPAEGYETVPHPEFIADWKDSPEETAHRRELGGLLESALNSLDEKHRMIFLLRDVEGLSIKETAAALGISEANTKVRLLRARLQLRERLTHALGDPATQIKRGPHDHE